MITRHQDYSYTTREIWTARSGQNSYIKTSGAFVRIHFEVLASPDHPRIKVSPTKDTKPRYHGTNSILIMAPSAVETITTQVAPAVLKLHTTQSGSGDYKAIQGYGLDKEAEAGKKGFEAAKVRYG